MAARPGIAQLRVANYLLYVGQTNSIRTRYGSYKTEHQKVKPRHRILDMLNRFESHLWFYYCELKPGVSPTSVEDDLLGAFIPPFNNSWPATIRAPKRALQ